MYIKKERIQTRGRIQIYVIKKTYTLLKQTYFHKILDKYKRKATHVILLHLSFSKNM